MSSRIGCRARWRVAFRAAVTGSALAAVATAGALASGGFYVVDDSEVDAPGSCKIESTVSFASNRDFIGGTTPSCVANLGRPVEIALPVQTLREGGSWTTVIGLEGKTNFIS